MEIVRATAADAGRVRELSRAAYAKWVPVIGREPWPMTADYDVAVREHVIDLLVVDGGVVALMEMIPEEGHLLIENVAVDPGFQGRGYGRRLMDHAEAVAAARAYKMVRLYTNKMFAANVQMYLGLGYAITREEVLPAGTVVHMHKML